MVPGDSSSKLRSHITISPWIFCSICVLSLFVIVVCYSSTEKNVIYEYGKKRVYSEKRKDRSVRSQLVPTVAFRKELCLHGDLFATSRGAGYGNVAFEMLTLIGISDYLKRLPVISSNVTRRVMVNTLKNFPNLWEFLDNIELTSNCKRATVSTRLDDCCKFDHPQVEKMNVEWSEAPSILLNIMFGQSFKYFQTLSRKRIMYLLRAPYPVVRFAKNELFPKNAKRLKKKNFCIHIRRGDFVNNRNSLPSDDRFVTRAMEFIVQKENLTYSNGDIYVFSNYTSWSKNVISSKFNQAFFALKNANFPPNSEWEFSKLYCDIVLQTASVSTFGWWLGFLSRGQRVYYNNEYSAPGGIETQLNPADFFPPHWIPLEMNKNLDIMEANRNPGFFG